MNAGLCTICKTAVVYQKEDFVKIVVQTGKVYFYHGECFWKTLRPSILEFDDDIPKRALQLKGDSHEKQNRVISVLDVSSQAVGGNWPAGVE